MKRTCRICDGVYDDSERRGKAGLIVHCPDCADDEDVTRYTGNMIYDHKTGGRIQVNKNPEITNYINASTRKHSYGSNFARNHGAKPVPKSHGGCLSTAGPSSNPKGKE